MFGKFAFLLVASLCVFQGFEAYSVDPENRGINDIVNAIKDIANKVKEALSHLTSNIPNIIKNLKEKIKEIAGQVNISNIVNGIKKTLDNIINEVGVEVGAAKHCYEETKPQIQNLVSETKAEVAVCKKNADDKTEELSIEFKKLTKQSLDLIKNINNQIIQCFKEGGLNPIKVTSCLNKKLGELSKAAGALVKQIGKTVSTATKTAADVTVTLTGCIFKVTKDVHAKNQVIISNFRKCVENLKQ